MIEAMFTAFLSICMLLVIVYDASRYIIPNNLNLVVLLLYLVAFFFLPIYPLPALGAAGLVLLVGLGFFALGLMGGGDVKLITALTLWTGWGMATVNFLVLTAVFGGILVVIVLLVRAMVPPLLFRLRPTKPVPRLLTRKEPVPYGLAIAGAFLCMLWTGSVPGL